MNASFLAVFAAATLSASPAPAPAARRVAVLDFSASWAAQCATARTNTDREQCEVLRAFADQARAGALTVLRPPTFIVMTRENSAQIIKDMGGRCSEGECEVETARLLGASVVISGEVMLLEGTYIVSLKVHDVTTAALLATGNTEAKSKLEAFRNVRAETERMLKAAPGLDASVAAAPQPAAPPPAPKPDPVGVLALRVAEEDAVVLLDGKKIGSGPLDEDRKVVEGTHRLTVMKDGYATFEETYRVEAGGKVKASPQLVAYPKAPQIGGQPAAQPAAREAGTSPWYLELSGGAPIAKNGLEYTMVGAKGSDPSGWSAVLKARVGYLLNSRWAVEAFLSMGHPGGFEDKATNVAVPGRGPFGGGKVSFEPQIGVGAGARWSPSGNRYFSVGADLGAVLIAYDAVGLSDWPASGQSVVEEDQKEGISPYLEANVRFAYPFLRSWYVAGRLGVNALRNLKECSAGNPYFQPSGSSGPSVDLRSSIKPGWVVSFPITVALGYRF
jgi:hypothetical protein